MKNLYLLALTSVFISISAPVAAQAKECSVGIYKTYTPRAAGKAACDDQNLPAEFAGDLSALAKGLSSRGYKAKKYDQCANGNNDSSAYSLISQLGDCVQSGSQMACKLYVALYDNATSKAVYENSIKGVGFGSVKLQLSEALESLPECESL